MFNKQQVLEKIGALLAYTIAQIPTLSYSETAHFEAKYVSLTSSMKSSVSAYFGANRSQFKKPLDDLGLYLHNDIWQRNAEWDVKFDMKFGTDYPKDYSDLTKLFYDFTWLMELTNEAFFNAWVYGVPETATATASDEGGETLAPPEPLSNSYISRLVSDLSTAIADELKNIDNLGKWLETAMGDYGSVMLWEETGALLNAPKTTDIAKIVFIDRGLLEAIEILDLPVYIPSYLRKDG